MPVKLQGIFTPTLVPLDGRGQIDEPELRRFIGWLIGRGVHGIYPNGSTGEFTRFTEKERRRYHPEAFQVFTDLLRQRPGWRRGDHEGNQGQA